MIKLFIKIIIITSILNINLFAFSHTVELTEKQLQTKLEKKFPYKKKKLMTSVTLLNPVITLKDDDKKIYLNLDLDVKLLKKFSSKATVLISSELIYEQKTYSFYLKDFKILELNIENIPKKYHKKIKDLTSKSLKILLDKYSVYKLKGKDLKQKLVKVILQDIKVENQEMHIKLGY